MENQKLENVLNLSLSSTEVEREKSLDLDVGYDSEMKLWEVIVKYSGDLTDLKGRYEINELLNEYAIVKVREDEISQLVSQSQIEYLEKPKNLFYSRINGMRVSCVKSVQGGEDGLKGRGVIVAIIDSGIDYMNTEFRNTDGSTRIIYIYDQSVGNNGEEYNETRINQAIDADDRVKRLEIIPSMDTSGHGTEVASVAVGNNGVASEANIIVVKLGVPQKGGFPRTIELMKALDYVVRKAQELNQPISINLSFGNTYGAHDGSSLLERYIDDIANYWKVSIIVSSGNEGVNGGHYNGKLSSFTNQSIELAVDSRQTGFNIQLWKRYEDQVNVSIQTPSGEILGPFENQIGVQRYYGLNTEMLIYYGEPSPYSVLQEIYMEFIPKEDYVASGLWAVIISAKEVVSGNYDLWLPSAVVLSSGTNFLRPTADGSITIPGTASRVITVGAYDALTTNYADFSGRGLLRNNLLVKPDVVAPGVDVVVTGVNNNVRVVSGTSYAAPFVTGGAALLMEWGIIKGNDPFLYGEKIKAFLNKGAKRDLIENVYPNVKYGYGEFCLNDSF